MGNDATSEKRRNAKPSAIDELLGEHEIHGLVVEPKRPHRTRGEDALNAQLLETEDVGTEVELTGQEPMTFSVAGQKSYPAPFKRPHQITVRGLAERSVQFDLLGVFQAGHVVETATADDADFCCAHAGSPKKRGNSIP